MRHALYSRGNGDFCSKKLDRYAVSPVSSPPVSQTHRILDSTLEFGRLPVAGVKGGCLLCGQ
ncbi:hypothetical protein I9X38_07510 [Bacillus mojavensis]|nr:hypothetical protein I9X38_07510 [Bacillus mojavensis]